MAKILRLPDMQTILADPANVRVIRAGLNLQRDMDDPCDSIITIVRPGADPTVISTTRREAWNVAKELTKTNWRVDPSVSPGGLWNARPPQQQAA